MEQEYVMGLSEEEVAQRVQDGLVNVTDQKVSKSNKEIIISHTCTYFNFLNIALAVLVLISGQIKNLTFLGVIFSNSIIGIVQEFKVKQLIDQLSVLTALKAKVLRSGEKIEIPVDEVVMDDVMIFENGNQVGSDCVVLTSQGMEVNESMITGESKPVKKHPGDHLMSGSYLVAGSGMGQVEHIGKDNYATQLASKARTKKRATSEMQDSIKRIIKVIGILIIPVGILLFRSQLSIAGNSFSDVLVNTVAGMIGMIPEGLVLLTSVSFILGVGRLAVKRALVQEMEAIEALARVDVLCLDKTGTITTGALEVVDIIELSQENTEDTESVMNELSFAFDDVNPTQEALMKRFTKTNAWNVVDCIPFASDRKYRAISFEGHGDYVLGAPEFIIKDDEELHQKTEIYSKEGLRVLLLAKSDGISSETGSVGRVEAKALILISDCIRETAKPTFDYFESQHVHIKVISGDNPVTVSNIAVKAGLEGGERYVDASTLPEDFEDLRAIVDSYTVFGRVTPEQKQSLVKAFQANDHIVGMVGDGVNDVLALKDADCGIAMAAGSDAAKQVAHIVLLDSDFASMKDIVKEGRQIISNIERVSALYLTKTIYSVLLCVIFIILNRTYPFIPIHLSIISSTAIGIPSFILTLEQTESVTQSGFLKHVLRISLPGALSMVGSMLLIQLLGAVFGFDDRMISTYNLVVAGWISMLVVLQVCQPLNKRRRIMCISVMILFILAILLLPGLFSVYNLFNWRMIFVVLMGAVALAMMYGFSKLMALLVH